MEGGGAGAVGGVEGGSVWEADVVHGHAGGLGAAELGEDDADGDVVDGGGGEVGVCVEGGAEHDGEEFLGVGVLEAALVGAADRRAQGREDDHVAGRLGQDGLDAPWEDGHGEGELGRAWEGLLGFVWRD